MAFDSLVSGIKSLHPSSRFRNIQGSRQKAPALGRTSHRSKNRKGRGPINRQRPDRPECWAENAVRSGEAPEAGSKG